MVLLDWRAVEDRRTCWTVIRNGGVEASTFLTLGGPIEAHQRRGNETQSLQIKYAGILLERPLGRELGRRTTGGGRSNERKWEGRIFRDKVHSNWSRRMMSPMTPPRGTSCTSAGLGGRLRLPPREKNYVTLSSSYIFLASPSTKFPPDPP